MISLTAAQSSLCRFLTQSWTFLIYRYIHAYAVTVHIAFFNTPSNPPLIHLPSQVLVRYISTIIHTPPFPS